MDDYCGCNPRFWQSIMHILLDFGVWCYFMSILVPHIQEYVISGKMIKDIGNKAWGKVKVCLFCCGGSLLGTIEAGIDTTPSVPKTTKSALPGHQPVPPEATYSSDAGSLSISNDVSSLPGYSLQPKIKTESPLVVYDTGYYKYSDENQSCYAGRQNVQNEGSLVGFSRPHYTESIQGNINAVPIIRNPVQVGFVGYN